MFPLSLSLVFARSHANDRSEKTIRSFFFLFPFSSGIVVSRARRFLSFSLFFSSRLSSETRRDRAFRDIYIYTARARDQREVRRMNTPSEEKEKRRSAERREETMFKMSARSLMRILIWKGKDKKNKGSKKPSSSLFLVFCLAHFFFFALHLPFFHLFLS